MQTIEGGGLGSPLLNAGAPSNGVTEVQTLTIGGTPDGGSFRLSFQGSISAAIAWSTVDEDVRDDVDAALEALGTIGAGGVSVALGTLSDGIGTLVITFGANLAKLAVETIAVFSNDLTGTAPTVGVAQTVAGVTATHRGAAEGAELIDITNKVRYQNRGSALEPNWVSDVLMGTPTISVGAQAGDVITVTIQLTDPKGSDLAQRGSVLAYLSDDANGDSVAGTAPAGGVAVSGDGLAIPLVAGKTWILTSEADGDIALAITEAGADTWYLILVMPDGRLVASGAITFT